MLSGTTCNCFSREKSRVLTEEACRYLRMSLIQSSRCGFPTESCLSGDLHAYGYRSDGA